jgi:hypothetical protein
MAQTSISNRLVDHLSGVLIIAYKENTQELEAAFQREGLKCDVLRQEDKPEYQGFSSSYRCMLNHSQGWKRASHESKPTLIVEADFVPVLGLGQLPLPFDPDRQDIGIAWLYTCAPQVYSVSLEGFAEGFSTGLVAYILTPKSANALGGLVEETTAKQGTGYVTFDSEVDTFLRQRHFKNYIPFRNYGEHGGLSNPEHRQHGMSGIHRADVLYGRLAFLPAYATVQKPSWVTFVRARTVARVKGVARLAQGRFLRTKIVKNSSVPMRLISFAVRRQFSFRL